jgi:hypothetical protein
MASFGCLDPSTGHRPSLLEQHSHDVLREAWRQAIAAYLGGQELARATLRQRGLSDETIGAVLNRHGDSEYFWRELLCVLRKLGDVCIDFDVTISDRPRSTASSVPWRSAS